MSKIIYLDHGATTAVDERVLNKGTAYISDVGMTGPADGVIGVDRDLIIKKFTSGLPVKHEIAKGRAQINAVIITVDEENKRASEIKRISYYVKQYN